MSEQVVTRLQAMYHSGQLVSYIVSKLPDGALEIGWIDQGLVNKGLKGNLQDKKHLEELVIPVDRFVRLSSEIPDVDQGIFILGSHEQSKHICIVNNQNNTVIGMNSGSIQIHDLLAIAARIFPEKSKSTYEESKIDYIEELMNDVANGSVTHLLALSVEPGKQKPVTWLKKILKTGLTVDIVTAQAGDVQKISKSILLLSRWLQGLTAFSKVKEAIGSLLLVQGSRLILYFWDSAQKIVTIALLEGVSINTALWKYVQPLWYYPESIITSDSKGPKVVVGKTEPLQTKTPKRKTARRSSEAISSDSQSIALVRTRLTEIDNRIHPLIKQIHGLKKRIIKITKDSRVQSMSENSKKAIEELRRIEKETKVMEDISVRLQQLEKQMESSSSSQLTPDEIQQIVTKMTKLRDLMDKIEIEIGQLETRASEIESLKFKRRTES